MDTQLLAIYLNDHLAGAAAASDLSRRCLRENRGNAVGDYLEEFFLELAEEREVLEKILDAVGGRPDLLKQAVARLGERLGRLKPNGRLLAYSHLSRLLELEALRLGVEGKLALWRVIADLQRTESRLAFVPTQHLIEQAEAQIAELEVLRRAAAGAAFAPQPAPGTTEIPGPAA
jgi:hypothetical protein